MKQYCLNKLMGRLDTKREMARVSKGTTVRSSVTKDESKTSFIKRFEKHQKREAMKTVLSRHDENPVVEQP